nr:SPASM domain-containing protein [Candidatus Hydrogenedentota bacterium]
PMVHITSVIQAHNLDSLPLMPGIIADLGADVLNLVTETRMHDLPGLGERPPGTWKASDIDWPRIPRDALQDALRKTEEEARRRHVELRLPRMPREELLRYYSTGVEVKHYQCRSPWNTIIVGRTGDVYPCWLIKIGNVREQSLKSIWNAGMTKAFRRACRSGLFPVCPGCCFIEYRGEKK